jgi:hypothetical protein
VFASLDSRFVDPERVWDGLAHSIAPVSVGDRAALNLEAVSRAEWREGPAAWLDATKAPVPRHAQLLEALEVLSEGATARAVAHGLAMVRAAWAHGPELTSALTTAGSTPARERGESWLAAVLASARAR